MNIPSVGKIESILLLVGVGIVGFAVYKVYDTGQSAAKAVGDTIDNISHSLRATWFDVKNAVSPGAVGPEGGGSRQELQTIPAEGPRPPESVYMAPGTPPQIPESVVPAWMLGGSDAADTLGGDDQGLGLASSQLYSPDAMGLS